MKKRTVGIAILILLLLVVGTVWAVHSHRNAKVREMLAKQQDVFSQGRPDQEKLDEFREEVKQLTPEQQRQVREGMRRNMERRMDKRIADFFALPPDQQTAYLDKQIQEEEKRRKEREARDAQNQNANGSNSGTGGQGANAGGQGGQRGPRNQSADAQALRRNQRLDNSTPEQRAQRNAYFAAVQQRRIQQGLSPTPQRGGR